MGVVVHHEKTGVDDALAYDWNVVKHILGCLHSGRGVDVAAEGGAYALEIFEHLLARKVLESVEAHVLEEVGEAVLARTLVEGTCVRGEVELAPLCRFVVVSDVISEAVFEFANPYGRIVRQRILCRKRQCSKHSRCNQKESFHYLYEY